MKVTYEGYAYVPKYEQRDGECPVYKVYSTVEEAESNRQYLLKESELKKVTIITEPLTTT